MAGYQAFREAWVNAGSDTEEYSSLDARLLRYQLYWAFYENSQYRNLHSFAPSYKANQALYKYIRGIYNPAYRLGEFWRSHLWGGAIDPKAGDGETMPSALPVMTENEKIRPGIAQIWKNSNWQLKKGIAPLYGSIMGDVFLQVIDDVKREKVYIEILHPSLITELELDAWGNVKYYEYTCKKDHPETGQDVIYRETAKRDGKNVIFTTYLNNSPYPWNGVADSWSQSYGFVPLVMIQHNDVGAGAGWSEIHPGRSKFQEVDDIASKLGDQIRRMVHAPWLMSGVSAPKESKIAQGQEATVTNTSPGREETPIIYAPVGASAVPLVAQLDINATVTFIGTLLAEIERDYPELQMDIWRSSGDASGRALRVARQRTITKVEERRSVYDNALVRALQMGLTIGGIRGYENFGAVNESSYEKGLLEFHFGNREVFAPDPLDEIELESAFWISVSKAREAGIPLLIYLKRQNWSKDAIKEIEESEEYKAYQNNLKMSSVMGETFDPEGQEGPNNQETKPKLSEESQNEEI